MENHIIDKIEISNFRSIHHQIIDCKALNIFSGLNDSGKSNVLKALNLFFNNETDFQRKLNFTEDFSKIELAKAQKSSKSKQLIRIKVFFKIPKGYKTLKSEKELFVEKLFDRDNNVFIKYSNESTTTIRTSISKLLNKIQYIYIPALKGENVIQYLLGLLGEYKLIEQKDIEELNEKVNTNTIDLSDLLNKSKIAINTSFGLPVLLNDFWQKLNVATLYEDFEKLDDEFKASSKAKLKKLNPSFYQIPLGFRGEGVKSKYIPPILQWLQDKNNSKIFIWGIDEPENSLEFRAAEELSSLFCNVYSNQNQIFLTSHSLAFINPRTDVINKPNLFRCLKGKLGETVTKNFNDLFLEQNKLELFEELGVLKVQREVIEKWRQSESQLKKEIIEYQEKVNDVSKKLTSITKPIVITEGKTDWKHMKAALVYFKSIDEYKNLDFDFFEYENIDMGESELEKMCEKYSLVNQPNKIIFIFDRDVEKHLKTKGNGKRYKKWQNNVFSFCIPIPSHRARYKNIAIESYYTDSDLKIKDSTNKCLFFTNEIESKLIVTKNLTTGKKENNESFIVLDTPIAVNEKEKKIYDHDASKILDKNGNQVAISKSVFAENVLNQVGDFANVDFKEFRLIFDIIELIVNE